MLLLTRSIEHWTASEDLRPRCKIELWQAQFRRESTNSAGWQALGQENIESQGMINARALQVKAPATARDEENGEGQSLSIERVDPM